MTPKELGELHWLGTVRLQAKLVSMGIPAARAKNLATLASATMSLTVLEALPEGVAQIQYTDAVRGRAKTKADYNRATAEWIGRNYGR